MDVSYFTIHNVTSSCLFLMMLRSLSAVQQARFLVILVSSPLLLPSAVVDQSPESSSWCHEDGSYSKRNNYDKIGHIDPLWLWQRQRSILTTNLSSFFRLFIQYFIHSFIYSFIPSWIHSHSFHFRQVLCILAARPNIVMGGNYVNYAESLINWKKIYWMSSLLLLLF